MNEVEESPKKLRYVVRDRLRKVKMRPVRDGFISGLFLFAVSALSALPLYTGAIETHRAAAWVLPFAFAVSVFAGIGVYLLRRADRGQYLERKNLLSGFAQADAMQKVILENSVLGIALVRRRTFVWVNARCAELFGREAHEMKGQSARIIYRDANDYIEVGKVAYDTLAGGGRYDAEWTLARADGTTFTCRMVGRAVLPESPREESIWVYEDTTEKKLADEALAASEAKYRELVQNANSAIIRWDADGTITFFNEYAQSFFGFKEKEVLGRNLVGTITPEREEGGRDLAKLVADISLHPERHVRGENENVCADGKRVWVAWSNTAILDERGNVAEVLSVGTDMTERKVLRDELERLASTDSLTGVANRRVLMERGAQEIRRARRYGGKMSMLMLDIDHFKIVNDTFGHPTGDVVLKAMSDICLVTLRDTDYFGRLGGEEFAAVLPETEADIAGEVAERLRVAISKLEVDVVDENTGDTDYRLPEGEKIEKDTAARERKKGPVRFTVSIGVATFRPEDITVDDVLRRADKALYRAKDAGRNKVVVV